jgi:hypothetical protein
MPNFEVTSGKGGVYRRIMKQFGRDTERIRQVQECAVRLVTKHTSLEPRNCCSASSVPLH